MCSWVLQPKVSGQAPSFGLVTEKKNQGRNTEIYLLLSVLSVPLILIIYNLNQLTGLVLLIHNDQM